MSERLAQKVAQGNHWNLLGWFQLVSFFSPRETVLAVENAFVEFTRQDAFREQYALCSLGHINTLITQFTKFGCVSAVHELVEFCFEDKMSHITASFEREPDEVRKLVGVVGENQFRVRAESALDTKHWFRGKLPKLTGLGAQARRSKRK